MRVEDTLKYVAVLASDVTGCPCAAEWLGDGLSGGIQVEVMGPVTNTHRDMLEYRLPLELMNRVVMLEGDSDGTSAQG